MNNRLTLTGDRQAIRPKNMNASFGLRDVEEDFSMWDASLGSKEDLNGKLFVTMDFIVWSSKWDLYKRCDLAAPDRRSQWIESLNLSESLSLEGDRSCQRIFSKCSFLKILYRRAQIKPKNCNLFIITVNWTMSSERFILAIQRERDDPQGDADPLGPFESA